MRKIITLSALIFLFAATVVAASGFTNPIKNGDFSDTTELIWDNGSSGYNHWRMEGYHENLGDVFDGKKWDMLRTEYKSSNKKEVKDGAPENYLEFKIVGSGLGGSGITLRYIPFEGAYGDGVNPLKPTSWRNVDGLQFNLTGLESDKYYYLEADVYIVHHTLEDSGWYAGLEWPVEIGMGFADANNAGRRFNWGFLDREDGQGVRPYTQIENKTWYHYRSPELRTLWDVRGKSVAYPIDRIYSLSVAAKGWNLKSRIANVEIVEYDTLQVSSPDDQVYP